jgi:hypothetical protein
MRIRRLANELAAAFTGTIRNVIEANRREKILADDEAFQETRTAFADRVTRNQFLEFSFSPASLVVVKSKPQSEVDLKMIYAHLTNRRLNPFVHHFLTCQRGTIESQVAAYQSVCMSRVKLAK